MVKRWGFREEAMPHGPTYAVPEFWTVGSKNLDREGRVVTPKKGTFSRTSMPAFILRNSYTAKVCSFIVRNLVTVTPVHVGAGKTHPCTNVIPCNTDVIPPSFLPITTVQKQALTVAPSGVLQQLLPQSSQEHPPCSTRI